MRDLQVVVADYATARIYRLPASSRRLQLLEVLSNPAARAHEQDLVSGSPGRVYNRAAGRPQSFDAHDARKRIATERFAAAVARRIAARCSAARYEDVVLVAGGRLLGMVERRLTRGAQHRLVAALPRDLGHLSEARLAREVLPVCRRAVH